MLSYLRRHPWLTLIACAVLPVVAFALFRFIDWTGGKPNLTPSRETTYVLGPIDDQGYIQYDVALNEIMSKGITPETNANVLLWQVLGPTPEGGRMPPGYFDALGIAEPSKKGDYIIGQTKWLRANSEVPPGLDVPAFEEAEEYAQKVWRADEHPDIAAWLQANEKPLNLAVEACRRPDYFNPLAFRPGETMIDSLLPNVQEFRVVAQLLLIRAMSRLEQKQVDAAWDDILACHRLGRHVGNGTVLIESLVGIALDDRASDAAVRFAQSDDVSTEKLRNCIADLKELRPFRPTHEFIDVGERIVMLSLTQSIHQGTPLDNTSNPNARRERTNLDLGLMLRLINGWVDQSVELARVDLNSDKPINLTAVGDQIGDDFPGNGPGTLSVFLTREARSEYIATILYRLLMPAQGKLLGAYVRGVQTASIERLVFALAIHKRETGQYPHQLAELVPEAMTRIPNDLFSPEPLQYERIAEGYRVYSIGQNGIDDEGQSYSDEPRGDDLVVTVPIPEKPEVADDPLMNEEIEE